MDKKTADLLHRYREGAASPDERRQAEEILERSQEAQRAWRADLQIRRVVREHASSDFQPFFVDRFMRRLSARKQPAPRFGAEWLRGPLRQAAWAGAVVILVAVLTFLFLRPSMHRVAVPYGETAVVALPDGSEVHLAPGTRLAYPRGFGRERAVVLNGEAYFSVVAGERPFRVETANAYVLVHGTTFNVRAWQDAGEETRVTLESGAVEVVLRQDTARTVRLSPGQMTVAAGDTLLALPRSASLDRDLAWRRGGIAFVDMPLHTVLAELQRRFDVEITVTDPRAARRHVTYLEPAPRSLNTVLDDISQVLDLEYRRTARGFVVSPR